MPISKAQKDFGKQVAAMLLIPESIVFLDVINSKRSTLRICTKGMDFDEKARIRAMKNEIKALASKINVKIAMSDKHPLGESGQIAYTLRRRKARKNALRDRNRKVNTDE